MEELDQILNKMKTGALETTYIQRIMFITQKQTKNVLHDIIWNEVAEILWSNIHTQFDNLDDHLLCGICFYSVLPLTSKMDYYLKEILDIVKKSVTNCSNQCLTIVIVYGLLQSPFLTKHTEYDIVILSSILDYALITLMTMAYEYSRYTFLVFKIISSIKKLIGTCFDLHVFTHENQMKLLNLVNHNWENPVTGVRDLNRVIFLTLILVMDDEPYGKIIQEIESFPWNKAKYLMLSEIIEHTCNMSYMTSNEGWIDAVIHSLHKSGLVSAGADMYYAIINKLPYEDDWNALFLNKIRSLLIDSSTKTIENFSNYWCLTTFKKYPTLVKTLLREISDEPYQSCGYISKFHIWKQANKLGLLEKSWEENQELYETVSHGLENCNVHIRMLAFDIVCISKYACYPNAIEYTLANNFLVNNINSDSSVLRQNMLTSLRFFLVRTHSAFLATANNKNFVSNELLNEDLKQFCIKIQTLIMTSLSKQGNYQRKITSLKLLDLFFKSFSQIQRKKQSQEIPKRSIMKELQQTVYWELSKQDFIERLISLLQDPSDDIRELVMNILLENFIDYLRKPDVFTTLEKTALESMKSKFFYEIDCGQTMIKLLLNILIQKGQEGSMFNNVEDIFEFAYKELISENGLERDIVESIECGKQQHSILRIISAVIDISIKKKYKLSNVKSGEVQNILLCLDKLSNQFTSDDEANADFAKISDLVQTSIIKSGHELGESSDATKITGMEQIVLNCMWLNVKETCVLASLLLRLHTEDSQKDTCERCLNVMTNVLETARHKGAMEAAGTSLGQSIQYLTSLPKGSDLAKLPYSLLETKLEQLIVNATKTSSSITRRGAGLPILVHRIVSSDMKKGKPLFHHFMKTLLKSIDRIDDFPQEFASNIDNEKDLPKAIYLHFLTRIIQDSSLSSDVMFYSAKLTELAFSNLTSKYWQIRNAALQLYGALIPKLIGQKKQSGTEEETIATVAFDEFRTHSPELWHHMTRRFLTNDNTGDSTTHSDMVSILNLLATCAKRYNFSHDQVDLAKTELFDSLFNLLQSPVHKLRRLTSVTIFNIFTYDYTFKEIMKHSSLSQNALHGCLLLLQLHVRHFTNNRVRIPDYDHIKQHFDGILQATNSFVCKMLFEDIFSSGNLSAVEEAFSEINKDYYRPGIHLWLKRRVTRCLKDCGLDVLSAIVPMLLQNKLLREQIEYISKVVETSKHVSVEVMQQVSSAILNAEEIDCDVFQILYLISLKVEIEGNDKIVAALVKKDYNISYNERYLIPLAIRTADAGKENVLCALSEMVCKLSDPETVDYEMRYIAALSVSEFAYKISELDDHVKINVLKSAIILLQDEDDEIRNESVKFYSRMIKTTYEFNPYECLNRIMQRDVLGNIFEKPDSSIPQLCLVLSQQLELQSSYNEDKDNPFSNDSKNIYLEVEFLKELIMKLAD